MRAFVTGASGFIGSHLVRSLLEKNWRVKALIHKHPLRWGGEVETVQGDVRDYRAIKEAVRGCRAVFHLGASLGASLIPEREFFQVNAEGTQNVLKAAKEEKAQTIIYLSSAGVLGSVGKGEIAGEDYPLNPLSAYDRSKREAEDLALKMAGESVPVIIIRPGWVYGPGDRRTFKLVRAVAGKRFILAAKGDVQQTPVFIKDLIDGIFLCLEKGRKGEIYHLAGNEVLPVREIAETIASAADTSIPRFSLPLPPFLIAARVLEKTFRAFKKEAPLTVSRLSFFIHPKPLSIAKARKELGYSPETDLKKGMTQTIAWYKENGWL